MVAIKPKIGDFLLKATNSVNLDDALNRLIKEFLTLKINSLQQDIFLLENKHHMKYPEFLEFYKNNNSPEVEEDFYKWDETSSLLDYYMEINEKWI